MGLQKKKKKEKEEHSVNDINRKQDIYNVYTQCKQYYKQ